MPLGPEMDTKQGSLSILYDLNMIMLHINVNVAYNKMLAKYFALTPTYP